MHAMRKAGEPVGRARLCELVEPVATQGERVTIVFDGPPPRPLDPDLPDASVSVSFPHPRTADDDILDRIAATSAPRRLAVVTDDRQLRRAAKRRRCRSVRCEEFLRILDRAIERAHRPANPEPPEKRHGLTPEQKRKWLRRFGFDPDEPTEPRC